MTTARIFSPIFAAVLALAACGGSDETTEPTLTEAAADDTAAATDTAADDPDDAADGDSPAEETPVEEAPADEVAADEVAAEGDEAEDDVAATVWDVDPFGSGCIPGTPDHLPDGLWFGFAVGYDDGAVEFDLACVWDREELFEAGVIGEDEVFPNDYVLNDNPIIRTLETAVDGVGHLVDENAVSVEVNLQAEWGEAHTSWGGVECPSDLCYVSVLVEAGVIVELREIYQS